jgi:predicted DCC family thiol-disulfide oxidoreductase YuxK
MATSGLLIYDADCGFCVRSLGWAIKLGITCDYASWQSQDLVALGLSLDDVVSAAWYVDAGRRWRGHEAIAQSLRTSRYFPVRGVGWLMGRPVIGPIGRPAYQWIADHRYQLPGGTDNCRLDGEPR